MLSEPGLIVTRSFGPLGVSGPAATPAVASRLVTSGVLPGSIADKPVPARYGTRAAKRSSPSLYRTLTWPVSLLVTTRSRRPSALVLIAWTSETPDPTGIVNGGKKGWSKPVRKLPSWLLKKTVRVPSPALRTTRSSQPVPLRSAAMICAGSWPVVREPIRTKPPLRQE